MGREKTLAPITGTFLTALIPIYASTKSGKWTKYRSLYGDYRSERLVSNQ